MLEVQHVLIITLPPTTRGYKRSIFLLYQLAGSTAGPYYHPITHNKRAQEEYPFPFPTCWKYSRPLPSPYHPQQEGISGLSSFFPHLLEVQQTLIITLPPTTRGYKRSILSLYQLAGSTVGLTITLSPTTRYKRSILFLSPLAGSTTGPYHHPTTHNSRVQEEYPLPFPTCWKYSRPLPSPYHPQQEGTRGVSSSFPYLMEVQQAITIYLSPTTRGHKRSILFLSPLAGSTADPNHHPTTHNKRVQVDYPLSFPTRWKYSRPSPSPTTHNKRVQEEYPLTIPTCWKYSRPLLSTYHPQQEGTRGVFSSFPHLLEIQQALTITLPPTTRGHKRSILFLS